MILSEVIMYKVINYQQICNLELFWQMKYSVYQKNTCKLCHNLGNISVALLIMNFKECSHKLLFVMVKLNVCLSKMEGQVLLIG